MWRDIFIANRDAVLEMLNRRRKTWQDFSAPYASATVKNWKAPPHADAPRGCRSRSAYRHRRTIPTRSPNFPYFPLSVSAAIAAQAPNRRCRWMLTGKRTGPPPNNGWRPLRQKPFAHR